MQATTHKPGAVISKQFVGNRFCIREVASRFEGTTVFFVHDFGGPDDHFEGPFYSQRQANDCIKRISR